MDKKETTDECICIIRLDYSNNLQGIAIFQHSTDFQTRARKYLLHPVAFDPHYAWPLFYSPAYRGQRRTNLACGVLYKSNCVLVSAQLANWIESCVLAGSSVMITDSMLCLEQEQQHSVHELRRLLGPVIYSKFVSSAALHIVC